MTEIAASVLSDELLGSWYATDGVVAVGPVPFQRLQSLVRGGKLGSGCLVRHEQWRAWQALEDLERLESQARAQLVHRVAKASDRAPPSEQLPASGTGGAPPSSARSAGTPRPSSRPTAVDPVGVLATATDLKSALLLVLSTAVAAASAQRGLVYQVGARADAATIVGAHGVGLESLLGHCLDRDDPALRAARRGSVITGDIEGGPVIRALAARLSLGGAALQGVALVPLVVDGYLLAMLELAHLVRPFRAREVARAEDVLDVFAERCIVMGWLD